MFRDARERLGLSQNRVAELTAERGFPVSRSAVSEIERDRNMPGIESLVALCEALQLEPREILERVIARRGIAPDVAGCSLDDLRRRVQVLYKNGQTRAADSVYVLLAERLEVDTSIEPTERLRLRAHVQLMRSWILANSGHLSPAEAAAKRALHLAAGSEDLQVVALTVFAGIHLNEGLLSLAQSESDWAVRLARANGTPRELSMASNIQACCLFDGARFEEAAEMYRRALEFAVQSGNERPQAINEAAVGACLARLGHPSAARRRYRRALELARKIGEPYCELYVQIETGRLAVRMDELDDADRCAAAVLRMVTAADHPVAVFNATWLRHQVTRRRNTRKPDRHTLAQLKRLYPRASNSLRSEAVREFRSEILGIADA